MPEIRAPRNRSLTCSDSETIALTKKLVHIDKKVSLQKIANKTINQNFFEVMPFLPENFVDLLIVDPPYNLNKNYNGRRFEKTDTQAYQIWFESVIQLLLPVLKSTATVYCCSDWYTSTIIFPILSKYFIVRNRITWEREKGRGAKSNWKNNTEDIWFCTLTDTYVFDVESVKLKRKVIAPYRHNNGNPKDWQEQGTQKYRLTHPSNIWTDLTVPFWSMPENTSHPTQKPEKLIAKLILASSEEEDIVFDPFLGSGTTSTVAKKLGRKYVGIEIDEEYCCWAEKRLENAEKDLTIQGYTDGVFWERNTLGYQKSSVKSETNISNAQPSLL